MAAELRFECKFCNNPIYAPYHLGGKRVKCPHCKNPVTVPITEMEGEKPAQQAQEVKQVKRKDTERRPVHARPSISIGSIVKLVLLLALAYGGYRGWQFYQDLQKKPKDLLREYSKGDRTREQLLLAKITKGDITEKNIEDFKAYHSDKDTETRRLVAKCLGQIGHKDALEVLEKLLDDEEVEVRDAAAKALGNIKTNKSVGCLIEHLKKEENDDVKNTIYQSLKEITQEKVAGTKSDTFWFEWWKTHQKDLFPDDTK